MGDDQNFAEKRDFIRMFMNAPVEYKLKESDSWETGTGIDLSGSGLSFSTNKPLAEGAEIQVKLNPITPVTPSLEAITIVTRSDESEDGLFIISNKIKEIIN